MFEPYRKIRFPEDRAAAFRPLHEDETWRAADVAKAEALKGARAGLQPIQVEVMDGPARSFVRLDQRERR